MHSLENFPLNEIAFVRFENSPDHPTIVFLHDSLGSIELWRGFPEQLGKLTGFNVLVYDRQGYGKSCAMKNPIRDNSYVEFEADILNALLDHWKIDKAILFGHSDGGSIALIAAAKYPEKIAGIITEGAHIFVEDVTVHGIKEAIELYKNIDFRNKLQKYHGNNTDTMFRAWTETWTRDSFRSWNIESFLPLIQCPALVIQGEKDEYGTLAQVDGIVSQTSGEATSCIIPGIGHTPHKESPETVLEYSAAFVKKIHLSKNHG